MKLGDPIWPFNGRVINNSNSTVRIITNHSCFLLKGKSQTNHSDDIDFVECPLDGKWYKIAFRNTEVNKDGTISFYSRAASIKEIIEIKGEVSKGCKNYSG